MKISILNISIILNLFLYFIIFIVNITYNNDLYLVNIMRIQSFLLLTLFILTIIKLYERKQGFLLSYLIYLFLTHFGIFIVFIFANNPFYNSPFNYDWFYFNLPILYFTSSIGIVTFIIISLLLKRNTITSHLDGNKYLKILGYILINLFTLAFIYWILSGSINLTLAYSDFHSSLSRIKYYEIFLLFFALGITFVLANTKLSDMKFPIIIASIPIVLLLLTGNRGEIFYPLLAGLGVLVNRGFKVNWKYIVLILLVFFLLFPLIKETRNLDNIAFEEINIDYSSSLVEVGYALRPLSYTILWDEFGEDKGNGVSYFVALQRQAANILPMEEISYDNKPYSFRDRLPTMGFSVLAEANYNFGKIGVIFIMSFIAVILYLLTNSYRPYLLTFGAGLLAILINNIRNSFSFVPGHVIVLIILIIATYIIQSLIKRGKS